MTARPAAPSGPSPPTSTNSASSGSVAPSFLAARPRGGPRRLRSDAPIDAGRGQQLIPWPNRIRDGRYTFDRTARQLPITEVALGNASHGLLRWRRGCLDQGENHLTVGVTLHPQPGWSWTLTVTTRYAVGPDGLSVTSRVVSRSDTVAPTSGRLAPYVRTESLPVEKVVLEIPAAGTSRSTIGCCRPDSNSSTARPMTSARPARSAGACVSTRHTGDCARTKTGSGVCTSTCRTGRATVWGEVEGLPVDAGLHRQGRGAARTPHGVAVEPMTCPPDAFNSGSR